MNIKNNFYLSFYTNIVRKHLTISKNFGTIRNKVFTKCTFTKPITGSKFYKCKFIDCKFTTIHASEFSYSRFSGCTFMTITHTSFKDCNLNECKNKLFKIGYSTFEFTNIFSSDFGSTSFINCRFAGVQIIDTNLGRSYFNNCKLNGVSFNTCNLKNSTFYLYDVNDQSINLDTCDLTEVSFIRGMYRISAHKSDFTNASFVNTRVSLTHGTNCNLDSAKLDGNCLGLASIVPSEGSFVAWKQASYNADLSGETIKIKKVLVKLLIPEDAKRSSGSGTKCRASKAKVLEIRTINDEPSDLTEVYSHHDEDFVYKLGKTVESNLFNDNRWTECTTGIHFFIDKKLAMNYEYEDN